MGTDHAADWTRHHAHDDVPDDGPSDEPEPDADDPLADILFRLEYLASSSSPVEPKELERLALMVAAMIAARDDSGPVDVDRPLAVTWVKNGNGTIYDARCSDGQSLGGVRHVRGYWWRYHTKNIMANNVPAFFRKPDDAKAGFMEATGYVVEGAT